MAIRIAVTSIVTDDRNNKPVLKIMRDHVELHTDRCIFVLYPGQSVNPLGLQIEVKNVRLDWSLWKSEAFPAHHATGTLPNGLYPFTGVIQWMDPPDRIVMMAEKAKGKGRGKRWRLLLK